MTDTGKKPNSRKSEDSPRNRRLGNRAIGDRLRQMYEGVVDESIPDDFLKLLEEAEQKERDATQPTGGEA